MIQKVNTPRINTNDNSVEVLKWFVEPFIRVEVGQEIVELETSKVALTLSAEVSGFVKPLVPEGGLAQVGSPLYAYADSVEELATLDSPQEKPAESKRATHKFDSVRFSRAAENWLTEQGQSTENFEGSGLVTLAMVKGEQKRSSTPQHARPIPATSALVTEGPLTPRQEKIGFAKRAEISQLSVGEAGNINSTLSVYFDSEGIRQRLRKENVFDANPLPLLLYELSRLLKNWPKLTAYFQDGEIFYYDQVKLGFAIDLGKGLKVASYKDSERLLPNQFFEETIEMGLRYMENKLSEEELTSATFTVTDLSSFDVLHFHPLINGYQSAILGVGGDSKAPGHPMSLNLTFDHRVLNGREVATFLSELKSLLLSYNTAVRPTISPITNVATVASSDCDVCGISKNEYYSRFGRDAYLMIYLRDNGSLGCVCHKCCGGWT